MKCPRCDGLLDERERQGLTVDVCPGCRGVWLDRGELEKLLAYAKRELEEERAYYNAPPPAAPPGPPPGPPPAPRDYDREPPSSDDRRRGRHAHGHHSSDPRYGYRKKSWLENLGDIFD